MLLVGDESHPTQLPSTPAPIARRQERRYNTRHGLVLYEGKKLINIQCDGARPACKRCADRNVAEPCHYTINTKSSKEEMVLEVQCLHRKVEELEEEKYTLRENIGWLEQIVRSLKAEKQRSEIISRLNRGDSYCNIVGWLGRPRETGDNLAISSTTKYGHDEATEEGHRILVGDQEPFSWTHVTRDASLIEHLLSLYFCWEYPVFTILSEHYFRNDMRNKRRQYCSPLLVNAILAVACRFSDRPEARTISDDGRTAGDHFFEEAELLLAGDSTPGLTTLQALGIMSVREASSGRESKGFSLAGQCTRMAIQLGLQLPCAGVDGVAFSPTELEVRAITFWGSFALEQ